MMNSWEDMMKSIVLLFVFGVFFSQAFCAIWHLNNDPSMNADFASITETQDDVNVAAGDTIYIYGSLTMYSNANITKPLTFIGPGYFLGDNPGLQHNTLTARVAILHVYGSGTVLAGLHISDYLYVHGTENSMIGCYFSNSIRVQNSNNLFQGCYIGYKSGYNSDTMEVTGAGNTIISNCFFGGNYGFDALSVSTTSSATVSNCVFRGTLNLRNTTFQNNILYKDPGYALNWNVGGTVTNNVFGLISGYDWATVISDPSNVLNYDGPLFAGGSSPDAGYQLDPDPANPALTAGTFDGECGMFGGQIPYKLSGIPAIPAIYELVVPTVGNTLPIRVKARSNQ